MTNKEAVKILKLAEKYVSICVENQRLIGMGVIFNEDSYQTQIEADYKLQEYVRSFVKD